MATDPLQPFLYGKFLEQESYHNPTIIIKVKCISASPGKSFHAVMSHFSLGIKVSLCWVNDCSHADVSHSKSVNYAITFSFLIFFWNLQAFTYTWLQCLTESPADGKALTYLLIYHTPVLGIWKTSILVINRALPIVNFTIFRAIPSVLVYQAQWTHTCTK